MNSDEEGAQEAASTCMVEGSGLPRGSYPAPFSGYLVLWLGSVILKSRYAKKEAGYQPLGRACPNRVSYGFF